MPSVPGGLGQLMPDNQNIQASSASPHPGSLNLASITDVHTTVAGGADTVSGAGSDTVGGAGLQGASGFDTVTGPHSGPGSFGSHAPQGAGTEQVVATQTQEGSNTVLHLQDGSKITVVGVSHIDSSFFH